MSNPVLSQWVNRLDKVKANFSGAIAEHPDAPSFAVEREELTEAVTVLEEVSKLLHQIARQ